MPWKQTPQKRTSWTLLVNYIDKTEGTNSVKRNRKPKAKLGRGTVHNKLDKEDKMQHLTDNLQNFITDRQGVVLLRAFKETGADLRSFK